jgi:hypothetical protein
METISDEFDLLDAPFYSFSAKTPDQLFLPPPFSFVEKSKNKHKKSMQIENSNLSSFLWLAR